MTKFSKNNFRVLVFFVAVVLIFSCNETHIRHQINIKDIDGFKKTIHETELLIKEVDVIPQYYHDGLYATFALDGKNIYVYYTMLHLALCDTVIRDKNDIYNYGKWNRNEQRLTDTVKTLPGLTTNEYSVLKKNLIRLRGYGIIWSDLCLYNDAKFRFFYYCCYFDNHWALGHEYLAVLSPEIVSSKEFHDKFEILDSKDSVYLLRRTF